MIISGLLILGVKILIKPVIVAETAKVTATSAVVVKKTAQYIDWGKFVDNGVEKGLAFSQDVGWTNIYNQTRPYIVEYMRNGWDWLCHFFVDIWDRVLSGEISFC